MRRVHISHTDLDGEGCLILYHKLFPDAEQVRLNYGEMETEIPRIVKDLRMGDHLLITDLNLNQTVMGALIEAAFGQGVKVRVFDHHPTTEHLAVEHPQGADDYLQVIYRNDQCATLMLFEYLLPKAEKMAQEDAERYSPSPVQPVVAPFGHWRDFVSLVNDYDLWLHEDQRSAKLNDLFWILGAERFHERFLYRPYILFTDPEQLVLKLQDEQKEKYLFDKLKQARVMLDEGDRRYAVVFADRFVSEVGHHLLTTLELDYAIMLDPAKGKGSIRSKKGFSARGFAQKFRFYGVHGGGQEQSAGFPLDPGLVDLSRSALAEPPKTLDDAMKKFIA